MGKRSLVQDASDVWEMIEEGHADAMEVLAEHKRIIFAGLRDR